MGARLRTRLAVGALAAVCALVAPLSARAVTGDDDMTAAGTVTFTPAVPFVGGAGGDFSYHSTDCLLVSDGGPPPDSQVPEAVACTFTSTGTYTSVLCGTMTLTGTGTLTGEPEGPIAVNYTATFVDGVGAVQGQWQDPSNPSTTKVIIGVALVVATALIAPVACIPVGVIVYRWLFGESPVKR